MMIKKQLKLKLIIVITLILAASLLFFLFKSVYFVEGTSQAQEVSHLVLNKNNFPINIDEILKENTNEKIEEEIISEEIDLEYQTVYITNSKLPSGTFYITQMGVIGKQEVIRIKKYKNDILNSEEIVANNVKTAAINKVVEIGTGSGKNYYKLKENDIVFVTPNALIVKALPSNESENIGTLTKRSRG